METTGDLSIPEHGWSDKPFADPLEHFLKFNGMDGGMISHR